MYFQELEDIKKIEKYKVYTSIINDLDNWIFAQPKYNTRLITVDLFIFQLDYSPIQQNIIHSLFNKLVSMGFFKKVFILECQNSLCNHNMGIFEDLSEALKTIEKYNENQTNCIDCECYYKYNIHSIKVAYKLISKPKNQKKNINSDENAFALEEVRNKITLSEDIKNDPYYYKKLIEESSEYLGPKGKEEFEHTLKILGHI